MSLDGIAIHALADELHEQLAGARIDKIQQPDSTTMCFLCASPAVTINCFYPVTRRQPVSVSHPAIRPTRGSRPYSAWYFANIWKAAKF